MENAFENVWEPPKKFESTIDVDPIFSKSRVSIIIPFHGEYNKVVKLLESLWLLTRSNPYEVCLVDDASPNADFLVQLDKNTPIKAIRSDKQLGFGGACQLGFNATKEPWVIFLHSDCVIEDPNWMLEMGKSLLNLKSKNVRMVSAKTNNPGDGANPVLKSLPTNKDNDTILETGFLPLYCSMCHRELFSRIGGFIKNYPFHYYEDEELAYRMNKFGYKQAICGKSWVYHEGAATMKSLYKKNSDLDKIIESNRETCIRDMKELKSRK